MYLEQIRPPRAVEQRKDNHMGIKIGINGFGRIGRLVSMASAVSDGWCCVYLRTIRSASRYAASICGRRTWTTWSIC